MFEPIRRKERGITKEEAEEVLRGGEYGILSTVGKDGYPYGVPVNYIYVNGKIGFHCAANVGHKLQNLKENEKVCFTVVGGTQVLAEKFSTRYESVVVFGKAKEAGDEKRAVLEGLIGKYSAGFREEGLALIDKSLERTGAYLIEIEYLTGKARR